MTVDVRPLPKAAFSADTLFCKNTSLAFTNNSTGSASWKWDFGDSNISSDENPIHSYAQAGRYKIRLISTSAYGCDDTAYSSVRITEIPAPSFTMSSHDGCSPLKINFTNTSKGEIYTYAWDFGNGQTSTSVNPPAITYGQSRAHDTIYFISLKISNLCGDAIYRDSVVIHPKPIASFVLNRNTGCSPLAIYFNNTSVGLPDKYEWDLGDGTTNNRKNPSMKVYNADTSDTTYTVRLIATNGCGLDTMIQKILVHPKSVFSVFRVDNTEGCAPLPVQFKDYSYGNGTYMSWDFGDGNVSVDKNPVHIYTQSGKYTAKQYVNNGCSYDTTSIDITVHGIPTLKWTANTKKACLKTPIQFTGITSGAAAVKWTFGDGDTSTSMNPIHIYREPGRYGVSLWMQSTTYDCTNIYTDTVEIYSLPDISFKADTLIGCVPMELSIHKSQNSGEFYFWDFGDGNTSTASNPKHLYKDTGKFTGTLMVTNTNGCRDTAHFEVHVYPIPDAGFTMSKDFVCDGPATIDFKNISTGSSGYFWEFGNGKSSTDVNPSMTFDTVGGYKVILHAFNSYRCNDTFSRIFHIYRTPVAEFTAKPEYGCEPLSVNFTNNSRNASSYIWDFGDGSTSTEKDPVHNYIDAGIYNVKLAAIAGGDCKNVMIKDTLIKVWPLPEAEIEAEIKTEPFFDRTVNFRSTGKNSSTCIWFFGDGESALGCEVSHRYSAMRTYRVMMITYSEHGCPDTAWTTVIDSVYYGLGVPNAFTPNEGPAEVRNFLPQGRHLKFYHLQIFDDWGGLLWETYSLDPVSGAPNEPWWGTKNNIPGGELWPQDVYVWKIEATFIDGTPWPGKRYSSGLYKKTGTVHLIR
jgi:PKD repeat protein